MKMVLADQQKPFSRCSGFLSLVVLTFILQIGSSPIRAQLVNDGQTNLLDNVITNLIGNLTVGTNGSFTLLVLSNSTVLTTTGLGIIGTNLTARSNQVIVAGSGSSWKNRGEMGTGHFGAFNTLSIVEGGCVSNSFGYVGHSASNNRAEVSGSGSVWSNRFGLYVGLNGYNNELVITNEARVVNEIAYVGATASSTNNRVVVTGPQTLWTNENGLVLGASGSFNQLTIAQAATVACNLGYLGGGFDLNRGSNNTLLVTDPGSLLQASQNLSIGYTGRSNCLWVMNGALAVDSDGRIGGTTDASNNVATVSDPGSTWSNRANLYVCLNGANNSLSVTNDATVTASNLFIGLNVTASNNLVRIAGNLFITNSAGNSLTDCRRGTIQMNSGLFETDWLSLTNGQNSQFQLNGGTLRLRGASVTNGALFNAGNGVALAS